MGSKRNVFSVTLITLFSRLLSLISVQVYMSAFGASNLRLNIYSYALTIPNVIFTCVGTALTTVVIPIYSSMWAKNNYDEAKKFLDALITYVSMIMLALILVSEIFAPLLLGFSEYAKTKETLQIAVFFLRILLPVMFFNGLNYIFQGILQSHGKFTLTAFVAVPSGLIVIAYVLFLGDRFGVDGLLVATLIGLSLQAVILLPAVIKTGYRYRASFDYKNPNLKLAGRLTMPALAGVSAYQINMFINISFASRFNAVTILNFVMNIVLVSVLTIIYSITNVYFPKLSVLWSEEKRSEYKAVLDGIFKVVFFLMLPATVGFILMRYRLFDLISRFGKFGREDVTLAGNILALYALGIVFICMKEIIDRAFYSQKKTMVSAVVGILIMLVNVSCSLMLLESMGVYALPLSYSAASLVGVCFLLFALIRSVGSFSNSIWCVFFQSMICSFIMGAAVYALNLLPFGDNLIGRFTALFIPAVSGAAIYFAAAYFLKISVFRDFISGLLNKKGREYN